MTIYSGELNKLRDINGMMLDEEHFHPRNENLLSQNLNHRVYHKFCMK